jgi:hypothetical protein
MPSSPPSTVRSSRTSHRSRRNESRPASGCRSGQQRPSLLHEPPDADDWTLSDIALEFAAACGYVLDDWQRWLVRWAFVRRRDGLWSARDYGIEVARQNGKNVVLEVIELCACLLFGDRLVTHSAQLTHTAAEHFRSLKDRIEGSDELLQHMPNTPNGGFQVANGKEQIEFRNGARVVFRARESKKSGRGPRPQRIVFDEALILEQYQLGSMAPGISAQQNPQILFASSPPYATSAVLHDLRKRALEPDPDGDRLFYAAWNNPPGTSPDDREAWYRVNPSLGYGRMTEVSLNANRKLLSAGEYVREHIGVPEPPLGDNSVWPAEVWRAVVDPAAEPSGRMVVAVDATPVVPGQAQVGSVAMAGGGVVALITDGAGARLPGRFDDLATEAIRLAQKFDCVVTLDPAGPANVIMPALADAGVEVLPVSGQALGAACGSFHSGVTNGLVKVRKHPDLDAAVVGASMKPTGDTWRWARRDLAVDVSPLVAVTLAWWAAQQAVEAPSDHFAIVL